MLLRNDLQGGFEGDTVVAKINNMGEFAPSPQFLSFSFFITLISSIAVSG